MTTAEAERIALASLNGHGNEAVAEPDDRPLKMVYCSSCSRPTGEFSRETNAAVGRCCENLPSPWDAEHNDSEDVTEPEEDERPTCGWCGSMEFIVRERRSQVIRTSDYDCDESALWVDIGNYEDDGPVEVECGGCARDLSGDVTVDWC